MLDPKDNKREQLIQKVFAEKPKTMQDNKPEFTKISGSLQLELFAMLEKYGYTRQQVIGPVSAFLANLNRIK